MTIEDLLSAGKEKEAADIINIKSGNWQHEQQILLKIFSPWFKDKRILFDLIINVYTNDGYDFPKEIIQKAKRIAKHIPENHRLHGLPDGDSITIYCGTAPSAKEDTQRMKSAISWTTDKSMAIRFADRFKTNAGRGAVWAGTIARDKIIAFTQSRSESEVIQYRDVQNITLLDITNDEWNQAIKHDKGERK